MEKSIHKEDEAPLVSVTMLVYNHARWLAQAIESVMMQEASFRYKLIIGEDCSTDTSREIAKKYYRMFPDRIVLLLNEHNLGIKGNSDNVMNHADGKYVATCEGDDYWIDPHKLQKQVDFLESHREYSAIYHSSIIVDEDGKPIEVPDDAKGFVYDEDSDLSWELVAAGGVGGQAASGLTRNPRYYADFRLIEAYNALQILHGDQAGTLLHMSYGKIRRCHVPVSAYRRSYSGSSYNASIVGHDLHYYSYVGRLETARFLNLFSPVPIDNNRIAYRNLMDFFKNIFDGRKGKIKNLRIMFDYRPIIFMGFIFRMVFIHIFKLSNCRKWMMNALKDLSKSIELDSNSTYIIFGTGNVGQQCMWFLRSMGWEMRIDSVWDNNEKKWGEMFGSAHIQAPGNGIKKNSIIIIASRQYLNEMRLQVQKMKKVGYASIIGFDEWVEHVVHQSLSYSFKISFLWNMMRYENIFFECHV